MVEDKVPCMQCLLCHPLLAHIWSLSQQRDEHKLDLEHKPMVLQRKAWRWRNLLDKQAMWRERD